MINIGMSTATFFSKSQTEDTVNLIQEMGVEVCEIFLTTFREYRREFIDLLLQRIGPGLEVHSVHTLNQQFEPELFNKVQRTREDAEEFFRECAEAAVRLNARSYTFHGQPRLKRLPYNIDYKWLAKRLKELDGILAGYEGSRCKIAYENVHWTFFNSPDFFRELKEYSDVEVCLDIKQAMQSKYSLDDYLEVMADRLVTVHLCDYHEDGKLDLPGKGSFDFTGFFRKLISLGYDGPLLMELYAGNYESFDKVKASYEYLKKCLSVAERG